MQQPFAIWLAFCSATELVQQDNFAQQHCCGTATVVLLILPFLHSTSVFYPKWCWAMPASSLYPHMPCAEHQHINGMAPHTLLAILASLFHTADLLFPQPVVWKVWLYKPWWFLFYQLPSPAEGHLGAVSPSGGLWRLACSLSPNPIVFIIYLHLDHGGYTKGNTMYIILCTLYAASRLTLAHHLMPQHTLQKLVVGNSQPIHSVIKLLGCCQISDLVPIVVFLIHHFIQLPHHRHTASHGCLLDQTGVCSCTWTNKRASWYKQSTSLAIHARLVHWSPKHQPPVSCGSACHAFLDSGCGVSHEGHLGYYLHKRIGTRILHDLLLLYACGLCSPNCPSPNGEKTSACHPCKQVSAMI